MRVGDQIELGEEESHSSGTIYRYCRDVSQRVLYKNTQKNFTKGKSGNPRGSFCVKIHIKQTICTSDTLFKEIPYIVFIELFSEQIGTCWLQSHWSQSN